LGSVFIYSESLKSPKIEKAALKDSFFI